MTKAFNREFMILELLLRDEYLLSSDGMVSAQNPLFFPCHVNDLDFVGCAGESTRPFILSLTPFALFQDLNESGIHITKLKTEKKIETSKK